MVWAGFAYGGVSDLVVLPKNTSVTKEVYYTLLNEQLDNVVTQTNSSVFQQGGAPAHTSKLVRGWFDDCGIDYIGDWPGQSPDLKQHVARTDILTLPKLEAELRKTWAEIRPDVIQNRVSSVPNQLKEVILRKGGPTRY